MMPPPRTRGFRTILCAVDFSPDSAKALRYAAVLSRASGGRVTALHAADPLLTAAAAVAYNNRLLERAALDDLEKFVRTSVRRAAADIRCVVQVGAAGPVVLAYARRTRPGLVVMGTHGRRGAAKFFFGSTTEAVLRRFRGPVLAIPPGCREPRPGWPAGSIVAAIDQAGAHHRASLASAARVAEAFGAWLSVAPPTPATARRRATRMIILPVAPAARLRMLREGSAAYRFVCGARSPVLVLRAGTRAGTIIHPSRAAWRREARHERGRPDDDAVEDRRATAQSGDAGRS